MTFALSPAYPLLFILLLGMTDIPTLQRGAGWRQAALPVSDGQILLPDPFIISDSIFVINHSDTFLVMRTELWDDTLKAYPVKFTYHAALADSVRVVWRSIAVSERFTFWHYQPFALITAAARDTVQIKSSLSKPLDPLAGWGGLQRSGFISRGLRVGASGEKSVASGMHLELSGEPAPGLRLEAILDDRDMPLGTGGSSSATWREFDRLSLQASTAHSSMVLGDFDLKLQSGRWGTFQRQLKGGKAAYKSPQHSLELAAAGGASTYRMMELRVQTGNYGPYELTDREGRAGVSVAVGSESLWLNGQPLRRGAGGGYRIDYERGQITFNPTLILRDDMRLEAEYEYNETAYPKALYAAHTANTLMGGEARWDFSLTAVQEGYDFEHPLSFEWRDAWRAALKAAGDEAAGAVISGIDTVAPGEGDYIWAVQDSQIVLLFAQPDSLGRPTGNLRVEFSPDAQGAYERRYDAVRSLFYYRWVGYGSGGYSPRRYMPLPERRRLLQSRTALQTGDFFSEIEAAASEYDRNVMSPYNDSDNNGEAWFWRGRWQTVDKRLTLSGSARRESERFQPAARRDEVDRRDRWGTSNASSFGEKVYEANIAFGPVQNLTFSSGGGFFSNLNHYKSQRWDLSADWTDRGHSLTSRIERLSGRGGQLYIRTDRWRWSELFEKQINNLTPVLASRYEQNKHTNRLGVTSSERFYEVEPGFKFRFRRASITARFLHRRDEAGSEGNYHLTAYTNSAQVGWYGRYENIGGWNIDAAHNRIDYFSSSPPKTEATAAVLNGDLQIKGLPFRLKVNYNLSSGNERAQAWVAGFVGAGRGGYRFEDGRYVPDPDGNFDLQTVATDTFKRVSRVDFSGEFEWLPKLSARPGISEKVYTFGISRAVTRLDAQGISAAGDPTRLILLDRGGLFGRSAMQSLWRLEQSVYVLDEQYNVNGRLRLRREDERDYTYSSGELRRLESVQPLIHFTINPIYSANLEPLWERRQRYDGRYGMRRSSVSARGGDVEAVYNSSPSTWQAVLRLGGETRREAISQRSVIEWRLQPKWTLRMESAGSLMLDGEWRRLKADKAVVAYDLLRGWTRGDNFSAGMNFDYRLAAHLSASLVWRARWRSRQAPVHSGLAEMTVNL